jgi:peroxiredoxin
MKREPTVLLATIALASGICGCSGRGQSRPAPAGAGEGAELIGTPAPAWEATDWLGSPPLTLAGLRGKVVLVRWFMSTDCPYCTASAPALNDLHARYAARGLVVIGMYHHKQVEPLAVDAVRGWAQDFRFQFPVAIDRDWHTLNRWWLGERKRDFTSVSFLIDRHGVIRHIHPGGRMALGTADFGVMQAKVEELLAER